jgi:hypothetical protein
MNITQKLKEPSTWAGLGTLAGLIGWQTSPDLFGAIGQIIIAAIGLFEIVRRERR